MKRKLTRPWKIAIYTFITVACFCLGWVMTDLPIMFPRLHMLSAEHQSLIGPSTLVDRLDEEEYSEFRQTLVGETEHGISFFCLERYPLTRQTRLYYREKTGDITVVPVPADYGDWSRSYEHTSQPKQLPIYVFHEFPTAVHAEMDIAVANNPDNRHTDYYGDGFSFEFTLSADYEQDGFFLFSLPLPEYCEENRDALYAIQMISRICHWYGWAYAEETARITVRLYDSSGQLLTEIGQVLRSDISIAHNWE